MMRGGLIIGWFALIVLQAAVAGVWALHMITTPPRGRAVTVVDNCVACRYRPPRGRVLMTHRPVRPLPGVKQS
jgi:hypothetical protein